MTKPGALPPIDFAALAAALLARAGTLVPDWLPGGALRGHEYVCGSLQGGAGSSCSVNLNTGRWADFAADERGNDLISLYAAMNGIDNGKAAVQLALEYGLQDVAGVVATGNSAQASRPTPAVPAPTKPVSKPAAEPEGWTAMMPVPAHAPAATFKHHYRSAADITHTAAYKMGGQLLGYVVRFKTTDGKETLPYNWCTSAKDGASRWHWKTWDEPRPLYVPGGTMPGQRTVVLVEGERKADMLHELLEAAMPGVYAVVSWPGGCKAYKKAMWDWLQGCTVLLWPDCDGKRVPLTVAEKAQCLDDVALDIAKASKPLLPAHKQPGMAAMLAIGTLLRDLQGCKVSLLPIPDPLAVPDGWDCADAIEHDGWDAERVLAFFGKAEALRDDDAGAAGGAGAGQGGGGGGGGGKKIDPPAEAEGSGDGDGAAKAELPWWLKPYYDSEKNRWLTSRKMVIAILTHDEELANLLGINLLSNNIEARQAWPWLHGRPGAITNAVDLLLGNYLTAKYGLPSIPRMALVEAIETVAHSAPFHPIKNYLHGLAWDKRERINKWLVYVLGETPESLPPAVYEYLCLVGRYWLLGMVNRVMLPGCKFDYCPVLEGTGGLGKSTLVELVGGSDYYSDTHLDLQRGNDAQAQVQGIWLYELAELSAFGKADIEMIKAFISAKVDRYRPSYGRVVESYPRQCVLVGTTNLNTYLKDRTGNRRFWPIPVRHAIKLEWFRRMRDQLFAEAYTLYTEGADYTPSRADEARLFVSMQESRVVETAAWSELMHVLTRPGVSDQANSRICNTSDFVTMAQLCHNLGIDPGKSNAGLEGQIRAFMHYEGWERAKKQINGERAWGFVRPAKWPVDAADDEPGGTQPSPSPSPTPAPASTGSPASKFIQEGDDAPF